MLADIAIVGMAGRFPGSATVAEYWQTLLSGTPCISQARRWTHPDASASRGGFLAAVDCFDAGFFRISPKEAACMDPQQRLSLETSWHAVEDSGLTLAELRKRKCGVFAAALPGDYKTLLAEDPEAAFSSHGFLGNAPSSLSGRLSYFYDFTGPSVTLDTACSSSLTALHLACLNIKAGICGAALVSAAAVFCTPELFRLVTRTGLISPSGRCAAFSSDADGFVPSEAVAALLLMPLEDANRQAVHVHGVISALAINCDGRSNGLMAPNSRQQAELIRDCYRVGDIEPATIGYVEAHGTGTKVGDPIELAGLVQAFADTPASGKRYLGSSKTVIGHTLVVSGLASVIKVLQMFRHGIIPPHRHFERPMPDASFGDFVINREPVGWPGGGMQAAISAFGFTGANAHVVLRPGVERKMTPKAVSAKRLFTFSARDETALRRRLQQFSVFLQNTDAVELENLSFSLCTGLEPLEYRMALIADSKETLLGGIAAQLRREELQSEVITVVRESTSGRGPGELENAAMAWVRNGSPLDALFTTQSVARLKLPLYPFEPRKYWTHASGVAQEVRPGVASLESSSTVERLKTRLASLLGCATRDLEENRRLSEYGVDSLVAVELLADFRDTVVGLKPGDLFVEDTLRKLARHIERLSGAPVAPELQQKPDIRPSRESVGVGPRMTLQWLSSGDTGAPIFMLPPLNARPQIWHHQIRFFAHSGYRIHVPFYPGHGASSAPTPDFSLEALATELLAYIDDVAGDSGVHLVGWSLGGCLAMLLGAKYPDRFQTITLISTAASFDDHVFDRIVELRGELLEAQDYLHVVFPEAPSFDVAVSAAAPMEALKYYYGELERFDAVARLGLLKAPTLVVYGDKDCVIGREDISRLGGLRNAQFRKFEDAGHFVPILRPREFNHVLQDFLKRPDAHREGEGGCPAKTN